MCNHNNQIGFIDEQEYMIMDRKKVQWRYAMTWFVPDLFSSLPIEIIELILSDEGTLGNFKATKALKLVRLLRIAKVTISCSWAC